MKACLLVSALCLAAASHANFVVLRAETYVLASYEWLHPSFAFQNSAFGINSERVSGRVEKQISYAEPLYGVSTDANSWQQASLGFFSLVINGSSTGQAKYLGPPPEFPDHVPPFASCNTQTNTNSVVRFIVRQSGTYRLNAKSVGNFPLSSGFFELRDDGDVALIGNAQIFDYQNRAVWLKAGRQYTLVVGMNLLAAAQAPGEVSNSNVKVFCSLSPVTSPALRASF